jgi:hypothetical protein
MSKEFLVFKDTEDAYLARYETETIEQIILADGSMHFTWDDQFKVNKDDFFDKTEYKYPEDSTKADIPFRVKYPSFEKFMEDYVGSDSRDAEHGRYGYWHNPNSKWDWYQIGGRWSGFFQLKPDTNGKLGERSLLDDRPDERAGKADQALKRDIDFDLLKHESRYEAIKTYDLFEEFVAKYPSFKGWSHFRDSMEIDEARAAYRNQSGYTELNNLFGFTMACMFDKLSIGREKYIKQQEASAFVTFAVIKDGKWYERGDMGWWGCVSDEKDKDVWNEEFMNLIESVPDDTLLSVVDCHI